MDFVKIAHGRACVAEVEPDEKKYFFEAQDEGKKLLKETSFKVCSTLGGKFLALFGLAFKVKADASGKIIYLNKNSFLNYSARVLAAHETGQEYSTWVQKVGLVYTNKNSPEHKKIVKQYREVAKEEFKKLSETQKNEVLQKFAGDFVANLSSAYLVKYPA